MEIRTVEDLCRRATSKTTWRIPWYRICWLSWVGFWSSSNPRTLGCPNRQPTACALTARWYPGSDQQAFSLSYLWFLLVRPLSAKLSQALSIVVSPLTWQQGARACTLPHPNHLANPPKLTEKSEPLQIYCSMPSEQVWSHDDPWISDLSPISKKSTN